MTIRVPIVLAFCIYINFPSVGIDADTDYSAFAVVTIKRDTRLGAGADIADEHVVEEEGRTFAIRRTDDFKTSLAHNSREFGSRRSRQG